MLIIRGINPRIRIDILLHTGWYKLIVLTFINLFVVLDVDLRWNYWAGRNDIDKMNTARGFIKALESGTKHIIIKRFTFRYPEEKLKFDGDGINLTPKKESELRD